MNIIRKETSVKIALVVLAAFLSLSLAPTAYGAISSITIFPSDVHANAGASYKIDFTLTGATATTTVIDFTFPTGFGVASAGPSPLTPTGLAQKLTLAVSGQIVRLSTTTAAGSATSSASQSVTITGITNAQQDGSYTISAAATSTGGAQTGTSISFFIQKGATAVAADTTAPVSTILNPASGATIVAGQSYTIDGTGTDKGGSSVTQVEVSVDGGQTWAQATVSSSGGTTGTSYSWSYVWANPTAGEKTIKVRATDARNNVESPGPSVTVTVSGGTPTVTPPAAETPITQMTVSELQTRIAQLQQTLISLLQQLLSLLTQQLQASSGGY